MAIIIDNHKWDTWNDFIFKEPDLFLYLRSLQPNIIPASLINKHIEPPKYCRCRLEDNIYGFRTVPQNLKTFNFERFDLRDYVRLLEFVIVDRGTPYYQTILSSINPDIFTDYDLFD